MAEGGEVLQPDQESLRQSSEAERLTRRMRFRSVDGSEYRIALPSVVNSDAIESALNRAGLANEGDMQLKQTPVSRALNVMYRLWEALGAKVEPLKPPEAPKNYAGKIEPGQ